MNLPIVEVTSVLVLIYPYWNVNISEAAAHQRENQVLIYPYWNVNQSRGFAGLYDRAVLIYPYWNVNRGHRAL